MNLFRIICVATFFIASQANAGTIDFIDLTESSGGLGESAWSPLTLSTDGVGVNIYGLASNDDDATQFAYLDWNNAGLGVCKDATTGAHQGSSANRCAPSSDDNVTTGEWLRFIFDRDVVVENLWFNNNHDGGFGLNDKVTIDGSSYDVSTGYAGGANGIGSFEVAANTWFDVEYINEEFYISAIEVNPVPEPTTMLLFGTGLIGLAGVARRRSSKK